MDSGPNPLDVPGEPAGDCFEVLQSVPPKFWPEPHRFKKNELLGPRKKRYKDAKRLWVCLIKVGPPKMGGGGVLLASL